MVGLVINYIFDSFEKYILKCMVRHISKKEHIIN